MNVLMYCLSSVSGGAVAYLSNLAPLLAERFDRGSDGHSLTFLAYEEQAPLFEGIDESRICWVRGARPAGARRIWWERRNMPRIVREQGSDVLITPYQIGPRVKGIRQVLMLRNMEPFLFGEYRYSLKIWLRNRLLRKASVGCLRRADRVIAVSGFAHEQLTRGLGIDAGRVRTIYHGRPELDGHADEAADREILRAIGIQGGYLLTCGSLLPYRRCEDVIAAFKRCAERLPAGTQLVITGAGIDRRYGELINRMVASSPYRSRIRVVGHVPWDTMTTLYRRSLMCVIATEIEACPNIAIEAMAAGCAIVSADRPPLPEMFDQSVVFYTARDVDALAHIIRQMAQDDDLRNTYKKRALERSKFFSWEKCARETYSALTDWQETK